MGVEFGTAPVEGTHLYYEVEGQGDWLVLAHGGEGTRVHWWQQVAAFKERYRCVTYDMRGFGSSPAGELPDSDDPMRDDLTGLLDALGIHDAILVGHSMGGLAVSGVAKADPARVRGLVMSDSPFNFATEAFAQWSAQMVDKLNAGFDVFAHLYSPDFERRSPDLHHLYRALNRLNPPMDGASAIGVYEAWSRQPIVDYSTFGVPTLFIVGSEDELTLPWLMRATATAVGGARLVEIDGAGHSGFAERADVFNAAVLDFCASLA